MLAALLFGTASCGDDEDSSTKTTGTTQTTISAGERPVTSISPTSGVSTTQM